MKKVILYIATSLDGYIARRDGSVDWLENLPGADRTDHGYRKFLEGIGATIMGRATYDTLVSFGIEWPYPDIPSFIVTRNPGLNGSTPNTFFHCNSIGSLVDSLQKSIKKDIWLIGGGQLASRFLELGLVDRVILSIVPIVLGEGIPLFSGNTHTNYWKLVTTESFSTGVVTITYDLNMEKK